jgi:bacteriocin-like protein
MEELTDEELLQINGGGFWRDLWGGIKNGLRGVKIPIFGRRF